MARNEAVDSEVRMTSVCGGSETQIATPKFRGGRVRAVFGSGDVDLRGAGLADSGAMVNVISIFGGITIQVPKQWDVNIRTRAVFGGLSRDVLLPTHLKANSRSPDGASSVG